MQYIQKIIVPKIRMRRLEWILVLTALLMVDMLAGCAASRSEVTGKFNCPTEKNSDADKVSVFFLFKHLKQQHGFDSMPKLKDNGVKDFNNISIDALKYTRITDFNNIFRDALNEISNISHYDTFTELPQDINNPARRKVSKTFKESNDYTLEIAFFEESSFKQQCFSGIISLLSLTVIPMPYSWDYTITANLSDKNGKLINSYQRKATLSNWVEALLIFAYPFHPLEGKREDIYAESLHDIFRQIETEKMLKK
jgi:hypothetical protein